MKRIVLFLFANLAVLVTLSVTAHRFLLNQFTDAQGLNFGGLSAIAVLFGFGGVLISRITPKWLAQARQMIIRNCSPTWTTA